MQRNGNTDLFRAPEHKLGQLATEWRTNHDKKTVRQYHAVLNALMELGWNDYLDADTELPDEYMPERYLNRTEETVSGH